MSSQQPNDPKSPRGQAEKEAKQKRKLSADEEPIRIKQPRINSLMGLDERLFDPAFTKEFNERWTSESEDDGKEWPFAVLHKYPFTLCTIPNFLSNPNVVNDMLAEIMDQHLLRKHMDLYEFYQTTDLCMISTPLLQQFFTQLVTVVMPQMEQLCNRRLTTVSASCSMYTCGDHLLVHDDQLGDRVVAYVYYLTPWTGVTEWSSDMGGALELLECDELGEPIYPVVKSIPPKNNQFLFFKVSEKSFHQVGEVLSLSYPRITINGWFHGPAELSTSTDSADSSSSVIDDGAVDPTEENIILSEWVSDNYLRAKIRKAVQNQVETMSEASLESFLIRDYYDLVTDQLQTDADCEWTIRGPAHKRNLEVLNLSTVRGPIRDLVVLLQSTEFFRLLYDYTELDLHGKAANDPKCIVDICRVTGNSYSMLDDSSIEQASSLDVILHFNITDDHVGTFTYIKTDLNRPPHSDEESTAESESDSDAEGAPREGKPEKSSVLLTIVPKNNALNLIYRCLGTAKFMNYVSKRAMEPDEYTYFVLASYRE